MPIEYQLEGKAALTPEQLQKVAKSVSSHIGTDRNYKIGLSFVDEKVSQKLNAQYANHDYPTDVLSFVYDDKLADSNDGDIAICEPIAKIQAEQHGSDLEAELVLLLVHGTLHILGQDHQDDSQAASMDQLQGAIMKELNYEYRDFKWSH